MPRPGIEPSPPAWQANTLPRRYKSRLVPQGSTSVSYTYHYYILPDPFLDSSTNLNLSNHSISGHQAPRVTRPTRRGYLRWAPNVIGETNSNHQCRSRVSNPGRLRDRSALYRVAIKAGLYRKAVQVYHITITTTLRRNNNHIKILEHICVTDRKCGKDWRQVDVVNFAVPKYLRNILLVFISSSQVVLCHTWIQYLPKIFGHLSS